MTEKINLPELIGTLKQTLRRFDVKSDYRTWNIDYDELIKIIKKHEVSKVT